MSAGSVRLVIPAWFTVLAGGSFSVAATAMRTEETGYTFDAVRTAVPELRAMVRRGNEEGP